MNLRHRSVVLEAAPAGGFVVSFPDVPEAHTQGAEKDEALAQAVDALETALEFIPTRAILFRPRANLGADRTPSALGLSSPEAQYLPGHGDR